MFDPRLDNGTPRSFDSTFKLPKIPPKMNNIPTPSPANFNMPMKSTIPVRPALKPASINEKPAEARTGLINLSKGKVKDASIYKSNFKFRTEQQLKPVLSHAADRSAVAKMLWNRRGGGGIAKWEVKQGLRKLEKEGKLNYSQVNALRKKLGAV
ncbi:MAG TPA: hypothetical protein VGQ87_03225 [Patescibacteria group bacterium]|jgi:hypothetical protein|nr:hypothetical protein [Patescibacteria group bacterium]